MTIKEFILKEVSESDYTLKEIAEKININYKTLSGKLSRETLKVSELFQMAEVIEIDLRGMQEECSNSIFTTTGANIIENLRGKGIKSMSKKHNLHDEVEFE